jgi:hypothetical protein
MLVNGRNLSQGRSAPADLKKVAGGFDLPIALGLLLGSGQVSLDRPGSLAIVSEPALTGETRPIKNVLAMALQAAAEQRAGLLVPSANASEAAVVDGLNVYSIGSLAEAVAFLSGQVDSDPHWVDLDEGFQQLSHMEDDFGDVKGQDYAKRALLIAAAGGHNILMTSTKPPFKEIGFWPIILISPPATTLASILKVNSSRWAGWNRIARTPRVKWTVISSPHLPIFYRFRGKAVGFTSVDGIPVAVAVFLEERMAFSSRISPYGGGYIICLFLQKDASTSPRS